VALSATPRQELVETVPQKRRMLGFTLREHLVALLLFAVITLAFFFPAVRGDTFSDVAGRQQQVYPWAGAAAPEGFPVMHYDQADSVYPWQVFMSRELRQGALPLWNPYSFGGTPFYANGQSGVLYPPRLLATYTVSAAHVHDVLLASHLFLAGVAMLLLLGYFGLSFPAALVGGTAWMLNTFGLSWQALEHYVVVAVWMPVGVLLADLAVRRRSWAAAGGLGVVVGLLFAGGNVLFAELAVSMIFGYGIIRALAQREHDWRSYAGITARLVGAAALGVGLAAVPLLPTLALAGENSRAALTYGQLGDFALPWENLQYIFRLPPNPIKFDPYHNDLFAGSAIAVLALVGLLRREFAARFAAALAVLTLLYMLHTPITRVAIEVLPGLNNLKPLSRAAFLFQFALVVLAAFGLDEVLTRLAGRARGRLARPAIVVFIVAALVGASIVWQEWTWRNEVMLHQPASPRYLYPATPLTRELSAPKRRFLPTYPSFRGSTAMIPELQSMGGYESLLPSRIQNFWRVVGEGVPPEALVSRPLVFAYHPGFMLANLRAKLLAKASVAAVVSPPEEVASDAVPSGLSLVRAGSDGRIFAVAGALPRAYVVGGCEEAPSSFAALERFLADDFQPAKSVILEREFLGDTQACSTSSPGLAGTAAVVRESVNSLLVHAQASRPSWLVLTDNWDRGWSALVDDRPADVVPADSTFRAVRLRPGEHYISFRYAPPSFSLGVAIASTSSGIALGVFALMVWRRWASRAVATGRRPNRRADDRAPD
jgi:hypothetical protein